MEGDNSMDQHILNKLHKSLFGIHLKEIREFGAVIEALKNGKSNIITDLVWDENIDGEYHERHKIVLLNIIDDNRVVFYNPLGPGNVEAGVELGGAGNGPRRRTEGPNRQSVAVEDFKSFFSERDAVSFFPEE
jgi:hypothetical protein